jgi:hypothetical protein
LPQESRIGPKHELVDKEWKLPCASCHGETIHRAVVSAEYQSEYRDAEFSVNFWDEYQVVECQGCKSVSFRHSHQDTENVDHDPESGEPFLERTVELYPKRENGRPPLDNTHLLPDPVRGMYRETVAARDASLPVLAGIGIRALVETVCKERNTAAGSLENRIDALVIQGVLTKPGAEILHSLRIMGNQAAHE